MRFEKWQALGNDYVIVELDELPFEPTRARIRRLCESHFGLGSDGVLLLSPASDPDHVADLRIFNPDGSEAELSGNGAREAIMYLRRRGFTDRDEFAIGTLAGEIRPTITGPDTCRVDMGRASLHSKDFPDGPEDGLAEVRAAGRTWPFRHVSIGNPQCAIHVGSLAELERLDLAEIGPEIEASPIFPNRTNVSWFTELERAPSGDAATIRARIFERGVGETLSSGTGATGAAVAFALEDGRPDLPASVTVALDGGELEVEVASDLTVQLTGWARPVYEGRLSEDLIDELKEFDET
ncbi:MAG TPA: diaminopimelate epimerase [Solirubrobacteraceae bacterium]|nr:diaminopimelate epimerase [Solirubrobacteraceae bacterium]